MAENTQAMAEEYEAVRERLLPIVEEFEKKISDRSGRIGCTMFTLMGVAPFLVFFFLPDVSMLGRIVYSAGAMALTLVLFVTMSMKGDKRQLTELKETFDREFPPDTPERVQAIQVLFNTGETSQGIVKKILDQIPLLERDGMSAEQAMDDLNTTVQSDGFPEPAQTAAPVQADNTAGKSTAANTTPSNKPSSNRKDRYIPLEIEPIEKDS